MAREHVLICMKPHEVLWYGCDYWYRRLRAQRLSQAIEMSNIGQEEQGLTLPSRPASLTVSWRASISRRLWRRNAQDVFPQQHCGRAGVECREESPSGSKASNGWKPLNDIIAGCRRVQAIEMGAKRA